MRRELYYGAVDVSEADSVNLFAVPAFFITFRETLEAAIIIAVLLGLLDKLNLPHLKRWVWIGVLGASAVCIAAAIIVIVLINVLKDNFVSQEKTLLLEGSLSVIAAVLIAVVALSIGNIMAIADKYENRMNEKLEDEEVISKGSILFLSATAVLREGVETILFFTGIGAAFPLKSLPIPAITGAIVGAVLGILLYKFGGRMSINVFFRFTMIMLVFIGAGVFTNGMHAIQLTGAFGEYNPPGEESGMHVIMFDISECCGLAVSQFWTLMRVLFGYQPRPTPFEFIMYFLYHAFVWIALIIRTYFERRKQEGKRGFKETFLPWKR